MRVAPRQVVQVREDEVDIDDPGELVELVPEALVLLLASGVGDDR
ncbi:MAG: hypothetical protein ACYTFF_20875 [Planctomycetota bacterium]